MGKGIAGLEQAYTVFFTGVLIVLAILIVLCLVRAIIGPKTAPEALRTRLRQSGR